MKTVEIDGSPTSRPKRERDWRADDVATGVVALVVAADAAQGIWQFLHNVLPVTPWQVRAVMFSVFELTAIVCAIRARRSVKESPTGSAGVDGAIVWAVALLSATLSALESASVNEAIFRLAMPPLAAVLWERSLSVVRRRAGVTMSSRWRLTPERIAVALRLMDSRETTASAQDLHRRLSKAAKRAVTMQQVQDDTPGSKRARAAALKLADAMAELDTHTDIASNPATQHAFMARIEARRAALALSDVRPLPKWVTDTMSIQPVAVPVSATSSPLPIEAPTAPALPVESMPTRVALPVESAPVIPSGSPVIAMRPARLRAGFAPLNLCDRRVPERLAGLVDSPMFRVDAEAPHRVDLTAERATVEQPAQVPTGFAPAGRATGGGTSRATAVRRSTTAERDAERVATLRAMVERGELAEMPTSAGAIARALRCGTPAAIRVRDIVAAG